MSSVPCMCPWKKKLKRERERNVKCPTVCSNISAVRYMPTVQCAVRQQPRSSAFRRWKKLRYSRMKHVCEQRVVVGARWHVGTRINKAGRGSSAIQRLLAPLYQPWKIWSQNIIANEWERLVKGNISGRLPSFHISNHPSSSRESARQKAWFPR